MGIRIQFHFKSLFCSLAAETDFSRHKVFSKSFLDSIKVSSFYHLCVECFSQLSFDSEVYTKSANVADFVYISESNESCEKHSTQR